MITRRSLFRTTLLAGGASLLPQLSGQTAAPAAVAPSIFTLPPLGYAPEALEPIIDAATMTIHHDKHHKTYVDKLNEAVAKLPSAPKGTPEELKSWLCHLDTVPEAIRPAVRNHGGGHYNHTLFWESLSKNGGAPKGALAAALETSFKTTDACLAEIQDKGVKLFGSGWVWLAYDPKAKAIALSTTPNQDTPLAVGQTPLLGIDVWEHAYYLKYQNKRADYLKAILNVIHWDTVAARYDAALKQG
jgi:superoxide dismutase, Fe-Mn family